MKRIFCFLFLFFLLLAPITPTHGQDESLKPLKLQIPISQQGQQPLAEITLCDKSDEQVVCNGLAKYFASLYSWLTVAVSFAGVLALIFGGFQWLTSRGDSGQLKQAKKVISNAVIGISLTLGSYLILYTINPDLVVFKPLQLSNVEEIEFQVDKIGETYQGPALPTGSGVIGGSIVTSTGQNTTVEIQGHTLVLDAAVSSSFEAAVSEIQSQHPGFTVSSIHGMRTQENSCHGKGLAFDINPDSNPCQSNPRTPSLGCERNPPGSIRYKVGTKDFKPGQDPESVTKEIVQIFQKHGWCWGGNWRSFKDYMHFSRCQGECGNADPHQW